MGKFDAGETVFDHGELVMNLSICFCVQSAGFLSFHASDAHATVANAAAATTPTAQYFAINFIADFPPRAVLCNVDSRFLGSIQIPGSALLGGYTVVGIFRGYQFAAYGIAFGSSIGSWHRFIQGYLAHRYDA